MSNTDLWLDLINYMREFAAEGGQGFVPVMSKWHGSIPIWIDEIVTHPIDEDLIAFIKERCKQ